MTNGTTQPIRVLVCGARKDFTWHEDFSRLAQEIAQWLVSDASAHVDTAVERGGGEKSGVLRIDGKRKRFDVSKDIDDLARAIEHTITPKPMTLNELLLL